MVEAVHVTCLGLNCSVGLTPQSTAAALRAAIPGLAEIHHRDDSREPVVGGAVPGLPENLHGRDRVVELLVRAFDGVVDCLPAALDLEGIPILVCTGEQGRPGARMGGLVVAVDANRLKRPGVSDGIIPGECGSVALVTSVAMTPTAIAVRGLGFAEESATAVNDEPLSGKGMAAAAKQALDEAETAMHEVSFRLSDVSAEAYGFEELAMAQSRLMLQPRRCQDVWCPAGFIGDCGAALGIVQLAWAEQAFARDYAPGDLALAHGSAVGGARAAAVISGGPQRS